MRDSNRTWRWSIGVVVPVLLLLVSSMSAGEARGTLSLPSAGPVSAATPSETSSPYVTGATVLNESDSLTLGNPGVLNIFGMANGGGYPSTGFWTGNLVSAIDFAGYPAAAIAVTSGDSDNFTTSDRNYHIGGVGVSGFQVYEEKTKVLIPGSFGNSSITQRIVLNESALVVVVGLSGGLNNTIALGGVPGLVIDARGTGNSTGVMIGHALLESGNYSVTETETLHGTGANSGADLIGVFAFWNSSAVNTVRFTETGLPSGTNWSVTLNGATHTSTTGAVTFIETNGTYSYSVGSAVGFGPNPANGTLSVNGTSLSEPVTFAKVYTLTFDETTLPEGVNWWLTLTGSASSVILVTPLSDSSLTRWSDAASTIHFYVSNGTYSYSAYAVGYSSPTGMVRVGGQSPPWATVDFASNSSSSPGVPILYYAVIGGVILVVAVGVVVFVRRRRGSGPSGPKRPPSQQGLGDPDDSSPLP